MLLSQISPRILLTILLHCLPTFGEYNLHNPSPLREIRKLFNNSTIQYIFSKSLKSLQTFNFVSESNFSPVILDGFPHPSEMEESRYRSPMSVVKNGSMFTRGITFPSANPVLLIINLENADPQYVAGIVRALLFKIAAANENPGHILFLVDNLSQLSPLKLLECSLSSTFLFIGKIYPAQLWTVCLTCPTNQFVGMTIKHLH